jgi:hypothetical protein
VLNGESPRIVHVLRAMNCAGAETAMMNVCRVRRWRGVPFDCAVMTREPAHYDLEIARLGGRAQQSYRFGRRLHCKPRMTGQFR